MKTLINHLSVHCPFVSKLWSFLLIKLGVSWVPGEQIDDFFHLISCSGMSKRWRSAVGVAILSIICGIWLQRNKRIFEGLEDRVEVIWDNINCQIAFWLFAKDKEFQNFLFNDIVRD